MYIAHPTHGAGTRPNRTQPPTAARKTTLNAGQCVRQPREGRGRNRQPPPPKENNRGGRKGGRQNSPQPPNRPPTPPEAAKPPPPKGTEDRTPKEAQGDHPAKTGNTKPGTAAHREKGHRNMQTHARKKKKSQQPSPKGRGLGDSDHKARDRDTQQPKKIKSAKNTPRQPSQEGRCTAETRAQHARPHRTPEPETAGGKRGAHETTHVP